MKTTWVSCLSRPSRPSRPLSSVIRWWRQQTASHYSQMFQSPPLTLHSGFIDGVSRAKHSYFILVCTLETYEIIAMRKKVIFRNPCVLFNLDDRSAKNLFCGRRIEQFQCCAVKSRLRKQAAAAFKNPDFHPSYIEHFGMMIFGISRFIIIIIPTALEREIFPREKKVKLKKFYEERSKGFSNFPPIFNQNN